MGNQRRCFTCHTCGMEVRCSPGELPCEALKDWLTVSLWEGVGTVSHYSFCSFSCLKAWVDSQVPTIPEVFLESFGEDTS